MDQEKLKEKFKTYAKAVKRLKESLERDENDEVVLDAVIQRFEFTYELSWKLLKTYLSYNGIAEIKTPREAFKEAFAAGIILEGDQWIAMLDDRNITSHTYDEAEARKIYQRIKEKYFIILNRLKERVEMEIGE